MASRGSGGSTSDCFEVGEVVEESFVVAVLGCSGIALEEIVRISASRGLDRATTNALADAARCSVCGAFLSHLEASIARRLGRRLKMTRVCGVSL